ncbi:hypothetical protein AAIR98_000909 [Elusimicrobium simillimum]|uniref:hypothetical protein n=1 Tax=Elusimicrobium simillimum TaxID=3143438 RepID=UPI003C700FED
MKIADLFAEIGIKGGGPAIMTMKGLVSSSMAAKAALVAVVYAFHEMTEAARELAVNLDKYEAITGKSAEELQALSYEAAQANVSMEEVSGTIQNLQKIKTDVLLGKGMPGAFVLLGIDPNEDPVEMLNQLRSKIKELPPEVAKTITSELGISDNLFYMLSKSGDEFEKLNQRYVLTRKQREDLVKLNAEWKKFWFTIKQLSAQAMALSSIFQTKVLQVVLRVVTALSEFSRYLYSLIQANENLKIAVIALGAVLAVVFAPWYAALAAVLLIIEDIFVYFEGGDSVTGKIVEWVNASDTLKEAFIQVKAVLAGIWSIIEKAIEGWKLIKELSDDIGLSDKLANFKLPGMFSFSDVKGGIKGFVDTFKTPSESAIPSMPSSNNTSTSNNNTTNNSVNVYTQGGDSPRETGRIIGDEVSNAIGQSPALTYGAGGGGGR